MRAHRHTLIAVLFGVAIIGTALWVGGASGLSAQAQVGSQVSSTSQAPADDLQRSIKINSYKTVADSGPARGESLYFYKCWVCHNKYTIAANPSEAAPYLENLFRRVTLSTGGPVNDDTVAEVIRNGNARMPSFAGNMSEADIRDLVGYLKGGRCCLKNPPANPWYRAVTNRWPVPTVVSGGAKGVVRSSKGGSDSTEGIKVQLIAPSGIRTTVYTNEDGNFEFPRLQSGEYTLRIATPLEFKPYRRTVRIDGANKIDDIVLDRATLPGTAIAASDSEAVPATPENFSQLSGAEMLWNLPGTAQEKDTFRRGCGSGCHSYSQILRNRYDERSWGVIVDRMFNYGNAILLTRQQRTPTQQGRGTEEGEKILAKWLAKVRAPGAVDPPLRFFPRPRGASTRAVVTEYELPHQLLSLHDVSGDSKGNIWYTDYKTKYFGKLDPRTGIVTEYVIPPTPDTMVGTHGVVVDQKHGDAVWLSEAWKSKLTKFDPSTEKFTTFANAGVGGNFAVGPDGSLWGGGDPVNRFDPEAGRVVQRYPNPGRSVYGSSVSHDGNWWAGGGPSTGGNYASLLDIRTGKMHLLDMGNRLPGPSRGGFDPFGDAWYGGKNGSLVRIDTKALKMREYFPPTGYAPYTDFYEAWPDKNGEVWAGVLHGRGLLRYNPRTDRWVEYALPEPYGHNRRTWIDNTTNPVTVWYVDYQGYIVRFQPLE